MLLRLLLGPSTVCGDTLLMSIFRWVGHYTSIRVVPLLLIGPSTVCGVTHLLIGCLAICIPLEFDLILPRFFSGCSMVGLKVYSHSW